MLAVRAGALGDTLLLLPALRALRSAVGSEGAVELLGRFPQARLARSDHHATSVHDFDRGIFRCLFEAGSSMDEASLRRFLEKYDLVVAWAQLPRLPELLSCPVLTADPRPTKGRHASDHLADLLRRSGIDVAAALGLDPSHPELVLDEEAHAEADAFSCEERLTPGFLAIHPSSGSPDKNWHPVSFRDLAALATRSGCRVLWVEGEADEDVVQPLQQAVPGVVARGLSLGALGALLSRASLYVGNDSGVTHLAACCGAPTIAVFRSTDPECWAPRGDVVVVEDQLSAWEVWGIARERFARH